MEQRGQSRGPLSDRGRGGYRGHGDDRGRGRGRGDDRGRGRGDDRGRGRGDECGRGRGGFRGRDDSRATAETVFPAPGQRSLQQVQVSQPAPVEPLRQQQQEKPQQVTQQQASEKPLQPQQQAAEKSLQPQKGEQQQPKGNKASKAKIAKVDKVKSPVETMGIVKVVLPSTSAAAHKPVIRPDAGGTAGMKIALKANFFPMKFNENLTIFHYDIDLTPEIKNKTRLREVFHYFVDKQKNGGIFKNIFPVFDGRKNVYTAKEIRMQAGQNVFGFDMVGERRPLTFKIQLVNHINMSELRAFLDGKTREPALTAIQALDIVFREMPSAKHIILGRFFFTNSTGTSMGTGLELWEGYYQTVRPTRWKMIMLQIDTSVRVFHKGQHVLDLILEFFRCRTMDELRNARLRSDDWLNFGDHIKGLAVETTHQPDMKRSYRVIAVSKFSVAEQTFPLNQPDGKEVPCKVMKYFKDQYKMDLRYPFLPCLQAQPKEKHRYIPMEVCIVKKGQQLKKLTEEMTSQIIRKSAIPAPDRQSQIDHLMKGLSNSYDDYSKEFGISVSPNMVDVGGRILPAPNLEYKDGAKIRPRNGAWNMVQHKFYMVKNVDAMAVLCLDRRTEDRVINIFIDKLRDAARHLDMNLPRPDPPNALRIRGQDPSREAKSALNDLKNKYKAGLIIVVMPSFKDNILYGTVKHVGDTEIGVVTQCVQSKNVMKADPQTLANICMKINSKLGAVNTIIAKELTSPFLSRPAMIMGADVTHPSPGESRKPSIAAVTASFDQRACKYAAKISIQKHRAEIIEDLANITHELLLHFQKITIGKLPEKIIFYRDGVSEGQFREVLAHELRAVQEACYKFGKDYQPGITFVVVQKRHKTRLFCANPRDGIGKSGNIPAGTTVDTVITHPVEFDFYLCSHHGIQGTSRPAHYHVLYDDNRFTSDSLQQLTYQMCHVYARCTRSVSIPAPAYYAHHCAFRGRYYLDSSQTGLLPEDETAIPSALAAMNARCVIHQLTPGMFFA